jgi:hypothetical protein
MAIRIGFIHPCSRLLQIPSPSTLPKNFAYSTINFISFLAFNSPLNFCKTKKAKEEGTEISNCPQGRLDQKVLLLSFEAIKPTDYKENRVKTQYLS